MNPSDPVNFVAYWITTAIAVVALLMPALKWLARRWLNKIEVLAENWIEVNFGTAGLTVALMITVHGWPLDQFVRSMEVKLKRKRDSATSRLTWIASRPLTLAEIVDLKDVKVATGFKLAAGDAVPLNLVFVDHDTRQGVQERLREVNARWVDHLKSKGLVLAQLDQQKSQAEFQLFNSGAVGPYTSNAHSEIERLYFFWQPDTYELTLTVETFNPRITKTLEREFTLTKEQVAQVRLGVVGAIMVSCNQPAQVQTAVFPKLEGQPSLPSR